MVSGAGLVSGAWCWSGEWCWLSASEVGAAIDKACPPLCPDAPMRHNHLCFIVDLIKDGSLRAHFPSR